MDMMQNTTSGPRPTGSPRKVVDGDYANLLAELLGFTVAGVNETAQTMLLANLTEAEVISVLYAHGLESLRTVLSQGANIKSCKDFDPIAIWRFAYTIRKNAELELAKAVSRAREFYACRVPPRFTTPGTTNTVHLRPGAHYHVTSDGRNDGPLDLNFGGKHVALNPGETATVKDVGHVSISSITPQMLTFKRIGGELSAGTLADTLPVPNPIPAELLESEQTFTPVALMSTPPKKSWLSLFSRKSNDE